MNQSEKTVEEMMDETYFKFETFEHGDKIVMAAKYEGQFIENDIEVHFSKNKELAIIDCRMAYDHVLFRTDTIINERHRIPYEFDRKTLNYEIKNGIIRITANKTKRVFNVDTLLFKPKIFKFTNLSDNFDETLMPGYFRNYDEILRDRVIKPGLLGSPDPYMSEIACRYIEYEFSEDDDVERQKAEEAIKNMSQENNDSSDDEEKAEKDDEEKDDKNYAAKEVKGDEEPVEDICSTGEQSSNKVIVKVTITDKRPGDNNDSVIKEFNLKEKHVRMEKIQEEKLKNGAKQKHANKTCVTGEASSNEEIEKVVDENCQQMLQKRITEVTNNEESKEEEKEEIEGVGHHEQEEGTNSDSDGSFVKLLDEEHEEQTDEEVGTLEKTEAEEREEGANSDSDGSFVKLLEEEHQENTDEEVGTSEKIKAEEWEEGTNSDSDGSFVKVLPEEREEKVSDSDDSWEKHLEVESEEESHTASSEEWEVVDEEKRN